MTEPIIILPEAKSDVADARQWYEEQSPGLGTEFLRCIEATLLSIQRSPLIYPVTHETYRRAVVRRFPFVIFFEFDREQNRCFVYAIFHCSQHPDRWRQRLPP